MKNACIRSAVMADLSSIKRVIDSTGLFPSEELDGMFLAKSHDEEQQEFWLTYDNGSPVAVAYYAPERMTNGTWNLLLIAVHPQYQGEGIGKQLMEHVENALAGQNERVLLVETSGTDDFDKTRGFYRSIGYEEEARIRDYYDSGDDKVIFRKAL